MKEVKIFVPGFYREKQPILYIMNDFFLQTSLALVIILAPFVASADEGDTHSVYRITSYYFGEHKPFTEARDQNPYNGMMITGTQADILDDLNQDDINLTPSAKSSLTSGFSVSAKYSPTKNLALQGSIGVTRVNWEPGTKDTHSSWEANLGIIYKIFNNISYSVHFGYMDTGDVYEEKHVLSDIESVIMISNQLTLSF